MASILTAYHAGTVAPNLPTLHGRHLMESPQEPRGGLYLFPGKSGGASPWVLGQRWAGSCRLPCQRSITTLLLLVSARMRLVPMLRDLASSGDFLISSRTPHPGMAETRSGHSPGVTWLSLLSVSPGSASQAPVGHSCRADLPSRRLQMPKEGE